MTPEEREAVSGIALLRTKNDADFGDLKMKKRHENINGYTHNKLEKTEFVSVVTKERRETIRSPVKFAPINKKLIKKPNVVDLRITLQHEDTQDVSCCENQKQSLIP